MRVYIYILLFASTLCQLQATLHRDILTYVNDFRHLHSAGPLISSPTIMAVAQKSAERFSKNGGDSSFLFNSQFNTNHCIFKGRLSDLPKTCVTTWYSTMKDYSWCGPQRDGKARPFVNMLWQATTRAGIGISQGKDKKYYVVIYFSPRKTRDVKKNVNPVKIVTQASPKAECAKGYSRFGSSCFKFHVQKVTWEQAVTLCAQENATLTSVRNKKEEKFLRILQERGKGKGWMWIGLHDRLHEGHFAWLDGLDFAPGVCAPVSTNGGGFQNCVAWTTNKPLSCWSDRVCSERHSFMCRMPVEGKLTYRADILFKKFRWNPNFRNRQSKAFRDLQLGLKVTFKEVFQRSSGRIGGGLRSMKIKSVRPYSMKGRRRGTAMTLSIQFRSPVADPTLKFQKFLRPSERLLSITVDSPVIHKSSISNTQCFFSCRSQSACHSRSYYLPGYNTGTYTGYHNTGYHSMGYHNTGYDSTGYYNTGYHHIGCPSSCTYYTYTCPTYCPQSCCTQAKQAQRTSSTAKPTKPPTPAATSVNTGTAATTAPATKPPAPVTQASIQYQVQQTGYTPYQPYSQCNTCHLYSSPYCYTYCDESCCNHGNNAKDLQEIVEDMQENLKKFQAIVNFGKSSDLPGFEETEFDGNDLPLFGRKAKLAVKTLKKNIEKLEEKIKKGQKHFVKSNMKPNQNDFEGENLNAKDNNALPYFEEELSDTTDDFDINEGELNEPTKKTEDYPHMRLYPDDKNNDYKNDMPIEEEKHPDSPTDKYEKSYDKYPHVDQSPEEKSSSSENYFKFEENGAKHPDSPTDKYEKSFSPSHPKHTTMVDEYPHVDENEQTKYGFKFEEVGQRDPDSPTDVYENSLHVPSKPIAKTDSYEHPDHNHEIKNDIKFEEVNERHPGRPIDVYENSIHLSSKPTATIDNYVQPDHKHETKKFEDFIDRQPASSITFFENSLTSKPTEDKYAYPDGKGIDPTNASSMEQDGMKDPDSPTNSYENSP